MNGAYCTHRSAACRRVTYLIKQRHGQFRVIEMSIVLKQCVFRLVSSWEKCTKVDGRKTSDGLRILFLHIRRTLDGVYDYLTDIPRIVSHGYRATIASGGQPDRTDCG